VYCNCVRSERDHIILKQVFLSHKQRECADDTVPYHRRSSNDRSKCFSWDGKGVGSYTSHLIYALLYENIIHTDSFVNFVQMFRMASSSKGSSSRSQRGSRSSSGTLNMSSYLFQVLVFS
jgi:hypothetical protein